MEVKVMFLIYVFFHENSNKVNIYNLLDFDNGHIDPYTNYVIYVYNIVFNIYIKVHALCYTACNYIIKLAILSIKGRKHFSKNPIRELTEVRFIIFKMQIMFVIIFYYFFLLYNF